MNNEQIVRRAYELAEKVDVKGWVESFTSDGTFTDMSVGITYRGPDGPTGLGKTVEVYAKAFPDMHRELYRFFSVGDVVVVELALQGTHKGPLPTPMGILPDPVVRLLPLGNGDVRAARRALEYRSGHRSLVGGTLRIRLIRLCHVIPPDSAVSMCL